MISYVRIYTSKISISKKMKMKLFSILFWVFCLFHVCSLTPATQAIEKKGFLESVSSLFFPNQKSNWPRRRECFFILYVYYKTVFKFYLIRLLECIWKVCNYNIYKISNPIKKQKQKAKPDELKKKKIKSRYWSNHLLISF